MHSCGFGWALSAVALVVIAIVLGFVIRRGLLGILIDQRGRYSLTQVQLVLWTIVVLSLVGGVFWGRMIGGLARESLDFAIPNELLIVLGLASGRRRPRR